MKNYKFDIQYFSDSGEGIYQELSDGEKTNNKNNWPDTFHRAPGLIQTVNFSSIHIFLRSFCLKTVALRVISV